MARCQNLKKADTRHFENNFYSDNCYIPETEKKRTPTISDDLRIIFIQTYIPEAGKSGLRHFENNFYSDNCYMPESEKSRPPMF